MSASSTRNKHSNIAYIILAISGFFLICIWNRDRINKNKLEEQRIMQMHAEERAIARNLKLEKLKKLPMVYRFSLSPGYRDFDENRVYPEISVYLSAYFVNPDGTWTQDDENIGIFEEFWKWTDSFEEAPNPKSLLHQKCAYISTMDLAKDTINELKSKNNITAKQVEYLNALEEATSNDWIMESYIKEKKQFVIELMKLPVPINSF